MKIVMFCAAKISIVKFSYDCKKFNGRKCTGCLLTNSNRTEWMIAERNLSATVSDPVSEID